MTTNLPTAWRNGVCVRRREHTRPLKEILGERKFRKLVDTGKAEPDQMVTRKCWENDFEIPWFIEDRGTSETCWGNLEQEVIMSITVIVLGHGVGVPLGDVGNTNFAILADVSSDDLGRLDDLPDALAGDYLLSHYDYWLVDCGPMTIGRITGAFDGQTELPDPRVEHCKGVIITHGHNDHMGGLVPLAYRTTFIERFKPGLIVPDPIYHSLVAQCSELLSSSPEFLAQHGTISWVPLSTYFNIQKPWPDGKAQAGPLTVRVFEVDHGYKGCPCFGVVIEHGGTRVVFSGDTAKPLEPEWFEADAVFHDVQFYNNGKKSGYVHCPLPHLTAAVPPEKRSRVFMSHTQQTPPVKAFSLGFDWAHKDKVVTF